MNPRFRVIRKWHRDGSTLSPDLHWWTGVIEDTHVIEQADTDEFAVHADGLRDRLGLDGLQVVEITGEPCCTHNPTPAESGFHYSVECRQGFACVRVRVPAKSAQHAYEQVCRVVGVTPQTVVPA